MKLRNRFFKKDLREIDKNQRLEKDIQHMDNRSP